MVTATNIVPSVQITDRQYLKEKEEVQCKSAQAELSEAKTTQEEVDSKGILQKTDLLGIADWDPSVHQKAYILICEYACIFTWNDLDPGKISIFKHSIKLTDPIPFNECYRCIPTGMYEEVKRRMQEMLDVGAI